MLKKILLVLVILVVLGVGALVALGFYAASELNSEKTREVIRSTVSEKLGTEVRLNGHHISLLGTAEVQGLSVPNAAPHDKGPFLNLQHASVRVSLLSFLQGAPVVDRIELRDVDIMAHQKSDGGLSLPFRPKPPVDGADASKEPSGQPEEAKPLDVRIREIDGANINLSVFDPENQVLAAMKGLGFRGSAALAAGTPSADLALTLASLEFTPGLRVSAIESPLTYQNGRAQLSKFTGMLAGGAVEGNAGAALTDSARPFEATIAVKDAAMAGLMKDLGSDPETLTGSLDLDFAGSGSLNAPKDLAGKGTFRILKPVLGKLKRSPIPSAVIGIPALQNGEFDVIKGNYRIEGQNILVEEMRIQSKGLEIGLDGRFGFDKTLDFKGRMKVDIGPASAVADVAQNLIQGFLGRKKEQSTEAAGDARVSEVLKGGVPFTVTGTSDKPVVRPVGVDPMNLITLLARALGFEVQPPAESSPVPQPSSDPAPLTEPPAESESVG